LIGGWHGMFVGVAFAFTVGGASLLWVGELFGVVVLGMAAVLVWLGGAGTVWLGVDRLIVRSLWRFHSWEWSSLVDARSVTARGGGKLGTVERLELVTEIGDRFSSGWVCDPAPINNRVFALAPLVRSRIADHQRRSPARSPM
jgi:hypothetical protein